MNFSVFNDTCQCGYMGQVVKFSVFNDTCQCGYMGQVVKFSVFNDACQCRYTGQVNNFSVFNDTCSKHGKTSAAIPIIMNLVLGPENNAMRLHH